ncbi:transcriptional regulator with XRE-family HTH domain [Paenibacillus brasilensis]|uniref:Transcriptional regulator with XRE-family HTH domain n=1 Tax=Paenibacillus brasilensis TaxID=128574 RepID=A0ABU0KWN7_9BACL|nr:transcriptional regulator with XRE-family HTH domain [Paenibacillus brasilensis]
MIKDRGMTKKAFCEKLKISVGNLGDWRSGKTTPGTKHLIQISDFFNVSLDWLMKGVKPGEGVLQEQKAAYFFGVMGPLNYQCEQLSEKEKDFILEYIEFTRFRKEKRQEVFATQ